MYNQVILFPCISLVIILYLLVVWKYKGGLCFFFLLGKRHVLALFLSRYYKWLSGLDALFFSKQIFQGQRNSVKITEKKKLQNELLKKVALLLIV